MERYAAPIHADLGAHSLHVGPVIGILCNPRWNDRAGRLSQSSQLPALEKLLSQAESVGATAYLFRVEDVDFQNLRVRGYFRQGNTWRQGRFPMPSVIYDQLISRKRERSKEHVALRERLSRLYGTRIFNDGFFDKWQVYEWLSKERRLAPYLPRTMLYSSAQSASQFVKNHDTVYLKPVHGSLGLGIVRVHSHGDGSLTYEIKRPNESPVVGKAKSAADAVKSLSKRLQSRPYLLQQGIPLATIGQRPFDLRILMQRDGSGEWRRTKAFARLSQPGDITSNLSSGGEALPMRTALEELFPRAAVRKRCSALVQRVTKMITETLEKSSGRQFGELGIDLGVDHAGNVWVIEVNSKPWKSPTTEKGSQEIVDLAYERPIRYAIWLARQHEPHR